MARESNSQTAEKKTYEQKMKIQNIHKHTHAHGASESIAAKEAAQRMMSANE